MTNGTEVCPVTQATVFVKYCILCAAFRRLDLELNPGRRRIIEFLLFNAVIQSSFSFIGLCRTGAKLPQTCLCCRRLLVGSGVHCIAIRIVSLTLVFFSLESLLRF